MSRASEPTTADDDKRDGPRPELSILIVNYNTWFECLGAMRSLLAHPPTRADGSPMPYEVVVVDNCSPRRDPEREQALARHVDAANGKLVYHTENGGYSKGMNLALEHADPQSRWVLVSNPDVVFQPGCFDAMLRAMEADPSIGTAAPEGFWDEGLEGRLPPNILPTLVDLVWLAAADVSPRIVRRYSKWRSRRALPIWRADGDVELDMLSGCCFLMQRPFIDEIGFFDERFPLYYEDTDLSVRVVRAGRRIVQVAGSKLVHLYNRSGQSDHGLAMERYWTSRRLYYRKWYGRFGAFVYDLTRKFLGSGWAKKRNAVVPYDLIDLGTHNDRPTIRLPRACEQFVIEVALDPRFYLAAGVLGSGDRWCPAEPLFKGFGPTTYYFRALDVSDGKRDPELLGVYKFTLTYPSTSMGAESTRPEPSSAVASGAEGSARG